MRQTGNTLMKGKKRALRRTMKNENKKRKLHHYIVSERVLVKGDRSSKFGNYAYKGPYEIVEANNNGTIKIRKGYVTDIFNIKNIKPHNEYFHYSNHEA
eukprot:15330880-Ditylum_brightwellii.AAC.1